LKFFGYFHDGQWVNILPNDSPDIYKYKLMNLLSMKYLLSKRVLNNPSLQLISSYKDVLIYKNKDYIPLGTTFSTCIDENRMSTYSDSMKEIIVCSNIVLKKKDQLELKEYVKFDRDTILKSLNGDNLNITEFSNSEIIGNINSKMNSVLFFSIPFDKGWQINIDNQSSKIYIVNGGLMGIPIKKGYHKIELVYFPPGLKLGMIISSLTIILCIFATRMMRRLASNNLQSVLE
jgi:uncharacterized membrane protein YfhO